jgi:hypothetical protein
MNRSVKKFFMKDETLKNALKEGKDVYSTFASKLFNCDYEDCLQSKENTPYLPGIYRRKVAKTLLCAMYFSTKRKWYKDAFKMINSLEFVGENKDTLSFRS